MYFDKKFVDLAGMVSVGGEECGIVCCECSNSGGIFPSFPCYLGCEGRARVSTQACFSEYTVRLICEPW